VTGPAPGAGGGSTESPLVGVVMGSRTDWETMREASAVSQLEQQVRAVCGLPPGDTTPRAPAAMANPLGDLWRVGEPAWTRLLAVPGVHLHLYGKREPRPRRKMGHVTALPGGGGAGSNGLPAAAVSEMIGTPDGRRCRTHDRRPQRAIASD
jgi:hypothetical protein